MSKIKEKLLSKSNQFNYYKDNYNRLIEENNRLTEELNELRNLISSPNLLNEINHIGSFCERNYIDYYLRDDFEEKFFNLFSGLSKENKKYLKIILLRTLFVAASKEDTLFLDDEIKRQQEFAAFEEKYISDKKIGDYKFISNNFTNHAFVDLGFTQEDKDFLKDKDFIDAGAFTGDSSIPLSKLTTGNVHAFEPFKESFNQLIKNIELNNIDNIVPVNSFLSDDIGEVSIYLSGDNYEGVTSDSEVRDYDQEFIVPAMTVDDYVDKNNLDVGFIKIDVEGAEQDLLKGAINTIKKYKPILFISIYHKPDDFFTIKPMIDSLGLDYEFEIAKEQPWTYISDTIIKCRVKKK